MDHLRHAIINAYNPNGDGTVVSRTDALSHVSSYTYDDYRRLKSVTTPDRNDGTGLHTTSFYYDASGTGDDYRYADSNVTCVVLPSGKKTKTFYDENRRKIKVPAGYGSGEDAITSYEYDFAGNVTKMIAPEQQPGGQYAGYSTRTEYDERNRPWRVTDALNHQTTITYDATGRQKKVTRANNQEITYDTFDEMNRVTQQTVTQAPNPAATTKYQYYASGPASLLHTMQDPRLVANNRY